MPHPRAACRAAACVLIFAGCLALAAPAAAAVSCVDAAGCSLNGVCSAAGACVCDAPWAGPACATLAFAPASPAAGKNLFPAATLAHNNTWGGPTLRAEDGSLRLFLPLYVAGSLGRVSRMLVGEAPAPPSGSPAGPWAWGVLPDVPGAPGINPAALAFPDPQSPGAQLYSLWYGGTVRTAPTPDGPWTEFPGWPYPGGNPAPIYHGGAFFMTNQFTTQIFKSAGLGEPWAAWANISHAQANYPTYDYHVEDPFLWIDARGNWHIINHAYSNIQYEACASSDVSAHFFSPDGQTWSYSQQPYGHVVHFDDGSSHTYTTLERPNLFFNASGALTHLRLAADIVTGDEGCQNRTSHAHDGHCPCDNCKWDDLAATVLVALAV